MWPFEELPLHFPALEVAACLRRENADTSDDKPPHFLIIVRS